MVKKEEFLAAIKKEFDKENNPLSLVFDKEENKHKILKDQKETDPIVYVEDVFDYYVAHVPKAVVKRLTTKHLVQGVVQIIGSKL